MVKIYYKCTFSNLQMDSVKIKDIRMKTIRKNTTGNLPEDIVKMIENYFRKKGLGELIGTRTWGGLVGISGNAKLVDGGNISVPRFGIFDENGEWIIEGIGVYPDIEVVDRPEQLAKGIDPGIEKAVEVLLKELEKNPPKKVKVPASPNRSGWNEKDLKNK